MNSDEILQHSAELFKQGDRKQASKLLTNLLQNEPKNASAWYGLALCLDEIERKEYCFRKVLSINPEHPKARRGLESLQSSKQPTQKEPASVPLAEPTSAPMNQSSSQINSYPNSEHSIKAGGYVESILLPGEKVIATAKLHWVIFVAPIILTILAVSLTFLSMAPSAILSSSSASAPDLASLSLVYFAICGLPFWILAGLSFIRSFLRYKSTEFALTDKRVIGKTGMIRIHSLELVLGKVESIRIDQSIMGRLLDFGTLVVSGSGGTHQGFPAIAKPMELKQKINSALPNISSN